MATNLSLKNIERGKRNITPSKAICGVTFIRRKRNGHLEAQMTNAHYSSCFYCPYDHHTRATFSPSSHSSCLRTRLPGQTFLTSRCLSFFAPQTHNLTHMCSFPLTAIPAIEFLIKGNDELNLTHHKMKRNEVLRLPSCFCSYQHLGYRLISNEHKPSLNKL